MKNSEIWYDIKGYVNSYQFSNLNRVESVKRERQSFGRLRTYPETVLKPIITGAIAKYILSKNGKTTRYSVLTLKNMTLKKREVLEEKGYKVTKL